MNWKIWQRRSHERELESFRRALVSEERADKLSGAWGRHPLLGRMYLPAYRAGTERVAEWRRTYKPERFLPLLYGCNGLMDITTIENVLEAHSTGAK